MTHTKTCTRCQGTGKYSFNLKDGTVCYGCSGAGIVAVTTSGSKVKPTATLTACIVGDMIEEGLIYEVVRIDNNITGKTLLSEAPINQRVWGKNIITGKYAKFYRYIAR